MSQQDVPNTIYSQIPHDVQRTIGMTMVVTDREGTEQSQGKLTFRFRPEAQARRLLERQHHIKSAMYKMEIALNWRDLYDVGSMVIDLDHPTHPRWIQIEKDLYFDQLGDTLLSMAGFAHNELFEQWAWDAAERRPAQGASKPGQPKIREGQQMSMFGAGEDLPLFSGTAVRAEMDSAPEYRAAVQQMSMFACAACKDTGKVVERYCWCAAGQRARAFDAEMREAYDAATRYARASRRHNGRGSHLEL